MYFDGHVHGYERSYPVYQSQVLGTNSFNEYYNPPATVYVVNGNAGVSLSLFSFLQPPFSNSLIIDSFF